MMWQNCNKKTLLKYYIISLTVVFFSVLGINTVSYADRTIWSKVGDIQYNEDLFKSKYNYSIKSFIPEGSVANFKKWGSADKITYLIISNIGSKAKRGEKSKPSIQLWNLSVDSLKSTLIKNSLPSPVLNSKSSYSAYIDNSMLNLERIDGSEVKHIGLKKIQKNSQKILIAGWSPKSEYLILYSLSKTHGKIYVLQVKTERIMSIIDVGRTFEGYGQYVAWSPDSKLIYYPKYRKGMTKYHLASPDGSHKIEIISSKGVSFAEPSWTHPEYIFLYGYDLTNLQKYQGSASVKPDDFSNLYVFDVKKRIVRKIFSRARRSDFYPVASPDGKHIVFYGRDRLGRDKLMLTNSKGEYCVLLDENVTPAQPPVWSSDSKRIIYDKAVSSGKIAIGILTISAKK